MALRRALSKRPLLFFNNQSTSSPVLSTGVDSPITSHLPLSHDPTINKNDFKRDFLTLSSSESSSSSTSETGFFRRFLEQRRAINQAAPYKPPPVFLSIPVGDKLREKLWSGNIAGTGVMPSPPPSPSPDYGGGISVADVKKILRNTQLEKVRLKLKQIPENSISYDEYISICSEACDSKEQGLEFSKTLDSSGTVLVIGNVVFLRPDQVVKSVEKMINESMAMPNDPRKKELEEMEKKKIEIDRKAESQVKTELYFGLGFLTIQTLGFMRLTFWELSWDVMEPICFFFTSLNFGLGYGFFLKTSKEPSFESYFQRRFRVRQKKLMKIHGFDIEKYDRLRRVFGPPANFCDHRCGGRYLGKENVFDSCMG